MTCNMLTKTLRLAAATTFLLAVGVLFSAELVEPGPESARMRALEEALDRGVPGAERAFWDEVGARGAPLVETIEGRPGYARVTFLWKGVSTETRSVRLMSGPQILSHFKRLDFVRLPRSDVWYLTLDVPTGWRVGYVLAENADPNGFPNTVRSDPLNPRHSEQDPLAPVPVTQLYSIFETPGAPPEPWFRRHEGLAAGTVEIHKVRSQVLGSERTIEVYVPHGLGSFAGPMGSLYLFDGEEYLRDMRIADVLDNLIGERRIGPLIALMIHDLPGDARDRELSCDLNFTEFLATELVPWVRSNFRVSEDPRLTVVGGVSLGGLEAAFAACKHPELFGAVLAQSGSFWWRPSPTSSANVEPWMGEQYTQGPRLPVRFFLSVGRDEIAPSGANVLCDIRQMRDALIGHGYDVKYEEIEGQHDPINWRLTLPDGLIALDPVPKLQRRPAQPPPEAMRAGLPLINLVYERAATIAGSAPSVPRNSSR
jgi:enterochelin esterase-like enzyme